MNEKPPAPDPIPDRDGRFSDLPPDTSNLHKAAYLLSVAVGVALTARGRKDAYARLVKSDLSGMDSWEIEALIWLSTQCKRDPATRINAQGAHFLGLFEKAMCF